MAYNTKLKYGLQHDRGYCHHTLAISKLNLENIVIDPSKMVVDKVNSSEELVLIKKIFENINAENITLFCDCNFFQNFDSKLNHLIEKLKYLTIIFNDDSIALHKSYLFFCFKEKSFPKLESVFLERYY